MIKKLLFIVLLLGTQFMYAQDFPTTQWIDSADTSWYDADETEFELADAETLAGLSVLVANGNDFTGKTIKLTADIDLGENLWQPIGTQISLSFSGDFDGNGHTISNLLVNIDQDFAGLFGSVKSSQITNFKINKAKVHGKSTVGAAVANLSTNSNLTLVQVSQAEVQCESGFYGGIAGGLVGGLLTNSNVKWCSYSGNVYGGDQIGGLVGTAWDKTMIEESYSEGLVAGDNIVGGLVGYTTFNFPPIPGRENTVKNCYSRANVTATGMNAGGLYGFPETNGIILNTYSTGSVSASENQGGSIGAIQGDTPVTNTYFDTETSGTTIGIGSHAGTGTIEIIGKSTADMKTQDLVDLLNAGQENIWSIHPDKNDGYPILADNYTMSTLDFSQLNVDFAIFPTVNTGTLYVKSSEKGNFNIVDANGKIVASGKVDNQQMEFNISHLNKGVYWFVFDAKTLKTSKKFIKK